MHRFRRFACLLMTMAVFFFCTSAFAGTGYQDILMERTLLQQDRESNNNRWIEVPGRGPTLYFAQTNPFWDRMRYENAGSSSYRRFGDAGCCPTSVAIAFANLLPVSDLGKIRPYRSQYTDGYGISTAAMNPLNIRKTAGIQWLEYAEEYQRYLPLVFGQFAAGNNYKRTSWRSKPKSSTDGSTGTNITFVPLLCEIYGLNYTKYPGRMNLDWTEAVKSGGIAVALANSQWQPFSTGSGHYVAVVGCDDEYVYIMDPQDLKQEKYTADRQGILEVMESGLIRVKFSDFRYLQFGMIYLITNAEVEAALAKSQELQTPPDAS